MAAGRFVILPGYIRRGVVAATDELGLCFPSAAGFHDGSDPTDRFVGDQFAGIDTFPFAGVQLSLLAVQHRVVQLAEALLGVRDIRIYTAEAWAKFTGATTTTNRCTATTSTTPSWCPPVLLPSATGNVRLPRARPRSARATALRFPNPHRRTAGATQLVPAHRCHRRRGRMGRHDRATGALRPRGVRGGTRGDRRRVRAEHRAPGNGHDPARGARYTMHLGYRPARWNGGTARVAHRSHSPSWYRFWNTPHHVNWQLSVPATGPPVLDSPNAGGDHASLPEPRPVRLASTGRPRPTHHHRILRIARTGVRSISRRQRTPADIPAQRGTAGAVPGPRPAGARTAEAVTARPSGHGHRRTERPPSDHG